jgi:hypothetical protein
MAALTADRNTTTKKSEQLERPAAAAKVFYAGALVALDAAGRATPGAVATTLRGVGRCEAFVDNGAGAADAVNVKIRRGTFRWANSSAGDAITAADIGTDCYIVDDQTVAKTNGTNTRSVAGKIMDVDALGVWVRSGY